MKVPSSKQTGAATLLITVILLIAATLMMIYAAQYTRMQQKATSNQYSSNQAFEAAEAGLEYAVAYLQTNSATVTSNPVSGFINYTIATTTLPNNATYTIVYTNPTANNYNLLQIAATGNSVDGTATRVVRQQVYISPISLSTVETQGGVSVNGHGGNVSGNTAIDAGGVVDPSASSGGTVVQNDANLAGMTASNFFSYFFGKSPAAMKSQSTVYANGNSVPWATLSGTVWIDSAVSISGQTTVGSAASPVLLIVNGDYSAAGQATINGIVYVMGAASLVGNAVVNGAIITQTGVTFSGNGAASYNSNIIKSVMGGVNPGFSGYAKIPGTWKDF